MRSAIQVTLYVIQIFLDVMSTSSYCTPDMRPIKRKAVDYRYVSRVHGRLHRMSPRKDRHLESFYASKIRSPIRLEINWDRGTIEYVICRSII